MNTNNANQKKKNNFVLLIPAVLFLLLGVMLLVTDGGYAITGATQPINKLLQFGSLENHEGDFISVEVDAIIDNYAETKHTRGGIPTGTDQHYMVWLDDDSMISVVVSGSRTEDMDRVLEETWAFLNDEEETLTANPVHLEGKLGKLTGDILTYYQDCVDYYEFSDTRDIHYYQIDTTNSRGMLLAEMILFFGVGILFLVLFIGGRKKDRGAAEASPYAAGNPYGTGTPYEAANPYGTGSPYESGNPNDAVNPSAFGGSEFTYGTGADNPYNPVPPAQEDSETFSPIPPSDTDFR